MRTTQSKQEQHHGRGCLTMKTAIYLRLSREDTEKDKSKENESNSISNQRNLIMEFIKKHDNLEFTTEYVDDGLSGFDFERPEFERMLEDAKAGLFECIIVKDLSRLGRNFQKTEELMQLNFPKLGIRFISVIDGFDSSKELNASERLAIPVANLLNEYHVMETSRKVRESLENCRRSGKFICNKAAYGYIIKDKQLEIDPETAETVRNIFNMKISGMSNQAIGELLNNSGVLCPLEYKLTSKQSVPGKHFRKGKRALWSSQTVNRILSDPVYTGTLVQGKTMSPSYKDKRRFIRDPSEWSIVENAHEAIVSETAFQIVSDLLSKDGYSTNKESYLFTSFIFCANCGGTLYHRKSDNHKNVYWQCKNKKCKTRCNINEKNLIPAVFETLKSHMKLIIDFSEPIADNANNVLAVFESDNKIKEFDEQIKRIGETRNKLDEQYNNKIISINEYQEMTGFYDSKIAKIEFEKEEFIKKKSKLIKGIDDITERFRKYFEMSELTREIVVTFIEKIVVNGKDSITIHFRYSDFFTKISNNGGENNGS